MRRPSTGTVLNGEEESVCGGVSTPVPSEVNTVVTGDTNVGSIHAMLNEVTEEIQHLKMSGEVSDVTSLTTTVDEVSSFAGDIQPVNQMQADISLLIKNQEDRGSKLDQKKLRFLLDIFARARCLDWVVVLCLVLCDFATFTLVFDLEEINILELTTSNRNPFEPLLQPMTNLNAWLEKICPAYLPLLQAFIAHCRLLSSRVSQSSSRESPLSESIEENTLSRTASSVELVAMQQVDNVTVESVAKQQDDTEDELTPVEDEKNNDECVIS